MARAYVKNLLRIGLAGILAMVSAGPAAAGIDEGLVGYWSFDGNAEDASPNHNHGALVNGPIWSTDTPLGQGYSLSFDGVDDYVEVPDAPSLEVTAMTLVAWVKAAVVSPEAVPRFLGKARNGGSTGYSLGVNFGFPHFALNSGFNCGVSAAEMLAAGQWTHVAGTYDVSSGTMKIYVNGQLAGTGNCGITALEDSPEPLNIGREFSGAATDGDGRHFNGNLDEVRIYNRPLSPAEILSIYDTIPPVVALNGDAAVSVECHTGAYSDPGATALDNVDGDLTSAIVTTGSVNTDVPGTYQITYTATDANGNSASAIRTVEVVDTTPPVVQASLNHVRGHRGDDDDDDDEGDEGSRSNYYRISLSAADACDPAPALSAYIAQPLTPTSTITVSYQRERKNRIEIKQHKKGLRVKLEGPDQATLRSLLGQALATGGFSVADGQVVKLVPTRQGRRDDDDKGDYQYKFDGSLKLTSARGPGIKLVAFAGDEAGNQSVPVEVAPSRPSLAKGVAGSESLPSSVGLAQNYPNPFNPSTTISYDLVEAAPVRLIIYNAMGQQVRELVAEMQEPGAYNVEWNGVDMAGQQVAGGVYFYRLQAGEHTEVRKMLFAK